MTSERVRETIVNALNDVDVTKDVKPSLLTAFQEGKQDIRLKDLHLGSLARMEILVALEMEHGAVIAPREFSQFRTLEDIVARVALIANAASVPKATGNYSASECDASTYEGGPKPRVVWLLQRAFRRCLVVSQLNKTLKILEHRLTPWEFATLSSWHQSGTLIPARAPAPFQTALSEWLDQLAAMMAGSGKPEPEPFTYNRVAPAAVHFTAPGERAKKKLLIGFATIGGRQMWIPNPVLLQFIDAKEYDLLVVSDPWRTGFRKGVPLMGRSVTEVVQWVADQPWVREYGQVRTVGSSAGAYPAMLTARRLNAELAVSISGRFPEKQAGRFGEIVKIYFNTWIAALRNPRSRVLLIHGKRRRDKAYARRLAWLTGGNQLLLKMPGLKVRHNVVRPLIEHGELKYFLQHTLFVPLDSALLAKKRTRAELSIPVDGSGAARELIVRG